MKIIKYNPTKIQSISNFFNDEIKKCEDIYIMFIYDDICDEVKNLEEFAKAYANLLSIHDLPFAFFPYYVHFNKVLNEYNKFPNPRAHIKKGGTLFDVVNQPGLGMLVLNVNKIKESGFTFSGNYECAFYLQELIMFCKENNLYHSTLYFYDVFKSWEYLKSNIVKGYLPNVKNFKQEKELFYKTYSQEDEGLNNFIEKIRNNYSNGNELQVKMDELLEEPKEEEAE
jgi:hypothetical protein